MNMAGMIPDNANIIVSICSVVGGIASAMIAARVKRAISRDDVLIRGYDQYTTRLSARIDTLEKELDRRDHEWRNRLNDADQRLDAAEARLRDCEAGRSALRLRLDDLARRMPGGWPSPRDDGLS
jgi:hypothetical protein